MTESDAGAQTGASQEQVRRAVVAVVAGAALLALAAVAFLWPRGEAPDLGIQPMTYVDATITAVEEVICPSIEVVADVPCDRYEVDVTSGAGSGSTGEFLVAELEFGVPDLTVGDRVVLLDVATSPPPYRYTFADLQRSTPMWWLAALFVVVVVAFGRWRGLRALLGLGASVLVLAVFLVPSMLRDRPAVLVGLAAAVVIAFLALYLANGATMAATVALAGTLASLAVTVVLAAVAVSLTRLSGLADEQAQVLRVTADALDLRGLLIAGIVIGALGVLDDVTVTQVSTVAALRRAMPDAPNRVVYREAIAVGRDHVASTVNTLVLAYAGASLPLMLLFAQGAASTGRILSSELVATEVVRTLVGSIGLVLSVPITTALAAVVLTASDAERAHAHGHVHAPETRAPETRAPVSPMGPTSQEPAWEDFAPREERF